MCDILSEVLEDEESTDVRGGLAGMFQSGLTRVCAVDPSMESREAATLLQVCGPLINVCREAGLGMCRGLAELSVKLGQKTLEFAAQAQQQEEGGGGGGGGGFYEWENLIQSLEIQSSIINCLGDISGSEREIAGAMPFTSSLRLLPALRAAALEILLSLSPLIVGPQSVLLPSLNIHTSTSLSQSAYGLLGDVARSSLWPFLEPNASLVLSVASSKLTLWAAGEARFAISRVPGRESVARSQTLDTIANVVWSVGCIIKRLSPDGVRAVTLAILPGVRAVISSQKGNKNLYENVAVCICRLACGGGAASIMEAACASPSGGTFVLDVFKAASLLEGGSLEVQDAIRGMCALCLSGPQICFPGLPHALRLFASVLDSASRNARGPHSPLALPSHLRDEMGAVVRGYKASAGVPGWEAFCKDSRNLNALTLELLKQAYPDVF